MKRSLICFLLALVLSVSGVVYAALSVDDRADEVTYTQRVLLGDPSMVEGVKVTANLKLMRQHFWTTEHTLGAEPENEVDYTYYQTRQSDPIPNRYDGLYLSNEFDFEIDEEKDISELSGLSLAYRELYEEGSGGKERTERLVRLRDYYEFYPIGARIQLPGTSYLYWGSDFYSEPPLEAFDENGVAVLEDGTVVSMGPEALTIRAFQDFFRIPVLEDEYRNISIDWDGEKAVGWGGGTSADVTDWFNIDTFSVSTDTACYFTFSTGTYDGKIVDTGYIPGGYGIYCLPIHPIEKESDFGFDGRELSMVYPLDPTVEIRGLSVNREGKDLLLFTEEGDTAYLTVLDTATMQTRQRMELLDGGDVYLSEIDSREEFRAFTLSRNEPAAPPKGVEVPAGEEWMEYVEYITVLTWDDAGEYTVELMVKSEQTAADGVTELDRPNSPEVDWNGEELVLCGHLFDYTRNHGTDTCGYVVAVYDETGMTYYAEYHSSLETGNGGSGSSRNCYRDDTTVEWP